MSLVSLIGAIGSRGHFIAYRIVPKADRPGKTDKFPVNVYTGEVCDSQDPTSWVDASIATSAAIAGWPIGLVITEDSGFFCLDLDNALQDDGTWSPLAHDACRRFAGAAVEVSASGRGLHILGRCAAIPEHRTRVKGQPFELYTRGRFIALTGTAFAGDINSDHTAAVQQFIVDYLPEPIGARDADWTTGPHAGWRGGGTDEQIIANLRQRQSARSAFGTGASFADLYDANTDALVQAFPDANGYDESAADQALANHLAYATGFDCERTLKLMWGSALHREKWDRTDYLYRTILRAIAGKIPAPTAVDAASAPDPAGPPLVPPAPMAAAAGGDALAAIPVGPNSKPGGLAPGQYVLADEQVQLFGQCVYIRDVHQILMPDGSLLPSGPFNAHFGGVTFQLTIDGSRPTREAWNAFLFSEVAHFPRADGVLFTPKMKPREVVYRDGQKLLNTWMPVHIDKQPGDVSMFLDHLHRLYPVGRDADILLAYLAALVQFQGVKFKWAPLLQGVEGNGKTFFSKCAEYAIGQRYTHWPRADKMDKQFNAAFYGKLLICVEDVKITEARESLWETLKPMITGEQLEIEPKGVDSKVVRDVCFNLVLNTNHRNALRKTENDRRIAPLFGAQQVKPHLLRDGLTEDYFIRLYAWANAGGFAHIAHYLSTYAIPDELNPAAGMIRAPETSSTALAIKAGRGTIEQEIQEAVDSGRPGFRGGWINSLEFDNLLSQIGKARVVSRNARQEMLEGLGYHLHAALPDGRVDLPDGTRPKLYVGPGAHVSEYAGARPLEVGQLYLAAQVR